MSEIQIFTTNKQITDFHIPDNGVIINGLPPIEKKPKLSEIEILQSKVNLLESEIQKTREESYQEGFNACKASLEDKKKQELKNQIEILNQFKNNLENEIKNSLLNLDKPIMNISSKIAEKILENELNSSNKLMKNIQSNLDKYCNELADQTTINIKVNTENINLLKNTELKIDNDKSKSINLILDESLKPGECIIDTDDHIIDIKFQTQINHIINQISR